MFGRIGTMADRSELQSRLQQLLRPEISKDYGPNGLQVEDRPEVRRSVSGMTASVDFIGPAGSWGDLPGLAAHVTAQRGLEHRFIDVGNPA